MHPTEVNMTWWQVPHSPFYPVDMGGLLLRGHSRRGDGADHSHPSSAEIKNDWSQFHPPVLTTYLTKIHLNLTLPSPWY